MVWASEHYIWAHITAPLSPSMIEASTKKLNMIWVSFTVPISRWLYFSIGMVRVFLVTCSWFSRPTRSELIYFSMTELALLRVV